MKQLISCNNWFWHVMVYSTSNGTYVLSNTSKYNNFYTTGQVMSKIQFRIIINNHSQKTFCIPFIQITTSELSNQFLNIHTFHTYYQSVNEFSYVNSSLNIVIILQKYDLYIMSRTQAYGQKKCLERKHIGLGNN